VYTNLEIDITPVAETVRTVINAFQLNESPYFSVATPGSTVVKSLDPAQKYEYHPFFKSLPPSYVEIPVVPHVDGPPIQPAFTN
jgi:hypothetical protein